MANPDDWLCADLGTGNGEYARISLAQPCAKAATCGLFPAMLRGNTRGRCSVYVSFARQRPITVFAPPKAAILAGADYSRPFFIAQGCTIAEVEKNFPSRALWRKQEAKTANTRARAAPEAAPCGLRTIA